MSTNPDGTSASAVTSTVTKHAAAAFYGGPEVQLTAVHHVLVCLDRSAPSDGCLPYAAFAMKAFGAKLTLLHVLASPAVTNEPNRADALESEIGKREAEQYLTNAMISLGVAREDMVIRVAQGFPAEQIASVAKEIGADLTILSSHGKGGGSGATELGSIAQHVLSMASGSVLLVQPGSSAPIPPKRLLVPLDGSVRGESVLPIVVRMARLHGAEVLLVYVVTEPTSTAMLSTPDDLQLATSLAARIEASAQRYLARMRERLLPDVVATKTLIARRNDERQALLDIAVEQRADMVVLTAHGSTCNVERAFGSVTAFLLAHSQLPIFVMQDIPRTSQPPSSGEPQRHSLSTRSAKAD